MIKFYRRAAKSDDTSSAFPTRAHGLSCCGAQPTRYFLSGARRPGQAHIMGGLSIALLHCPMPPVPTPFFNSA